MYCDEKLNDSNFNSFLFASSRLRVLRSRRLDTLNYDLASSGFLSGVPHLTMGIFISVAGYFADLFVNKGYITITQVCVLNHTKKTLLDKPGYSFDRFQLHLIEI